GIIHSERALLALTQAGIERDAAYELVQKNAMRAWNGEGTLLDLLMADQDVARLVPAKALEAMFDLDYHAKQVDTIFDRVFGREPIHIASSIFVLDRCCGEGRAPRATAKSQRGPA